MLWARCIGSPDQQQQTQLCSRAARGAEAFFGDKVVWTALWYVCMRCKYNTLELSVRQSERAADLLPVAAKRANASLMALHGSGRRDQLWTKFGLKLAQLSGCESGRFETYLGAADIMTSRASTCESARAME